LGRAAGAGFGLRVDGIAASLLIRRVRTKALRPGSQCQDGERTGGRIECGKSCNYTESRPLKASARHRKAVPELQAAGGPGRRLSV
jgi:hypothetical protein